ncbi:MAG: hypothetical protein V1729_06545 [Candidatus Woesearchaeota archaeon]
MGLKQTALAIGIAIVFTVFIAYGLWAIYEPPKYYEYKSDECWKEFNCDKEIQECTAKYQKQIAADTGTVVDEGPQVNPEPLVEDPKARPPETSPIGYDDCYNNERNKPEYMKCMSEQERCQEEFATTTPRYFHARNSFFVLFVIAVLAILIGMFLTLESISSGFIAGGVMLLIWSLIYTAEFWLQWNKFVKLTALGIVLALLIYLGYKKIEPHTRTKVKKR